MRRTVLAIALLAVVAAGCAGPADDAPTRTETATQIPELANTTTATVTGELPTTRSAETTGTTETFSGTDADDEPQKGDQFLSATEVTENEAMAANASERAAFGNLSAECQRVVRGALECDCNAELDREFRFNSEDRIEVVEYDGTYYFLRVVIV